MIPPDDHHAYDPGLPILAELEHHVRALALAADAADAAASPAASRPPVPAPAGHGRRTTLSHAVTSDTARSSSRLLRRGAILAVLGCTVGATATALTRPSDDGRRTPLVVREGRAGAAVWRLVVARHEGRLCPALSATGPSAPATTLVTDCVAAPSRRQVLPTTALTTDRTVVAGLVGSSVRSVRVTVAGRRRSTRTATIANADGVRSFVVVTHRPRGGGDVVPRVRPYGAGGRPLARAMRDCSAAPRAPVCAP